MGVFDDKLFSGLSVFAAVVDAGSFAAAGDLLDMSQPGVSRAIARLEQRLGIRLFDRTTRVVSLTDEGRRFYQQVLPHMIGLEEASQSANLDASQVSGRLKVNVEPMFGRTLLGPHLHEFLSLYPELSLELIARDDLGDMVTDGFDLALRFGEPRDSSLIGRHLFDTKVVTVAAPAYLNLHGRPLHPEDIARNGHACIEFRNPDTGKPYEWEFRQPNNVINQRNQGRLTVNDGGTMISACVAGYGIAQMLHIIAKPLLASGQLVELFPDWSDETFPFYAYYPSRRYLSAKTRVLLEFVQQKLLRPD